MKYQHKGLEMTNYITTRIKMSGSQEEINDLFEKNCTDRKLDFEKTVPTPEELLVRPLEMKPMEGEKDSEPLEKTLLLINEAKKLMFKYGAFSAEEWKKIHWGTEGNAEFHVVKYNETTFVTKDAHPLGIMIFLCIEYPNIMFEVEYASEKLGENCAKYVMSQGNPITYLETLVDMSKRDQAKTWARELVFGENSPLESKYKKENEIC